MVHGIEVETHEGPIFHAYYLTDLDKICCFNCYINAHHFVALI